MKNQKTVSWTQLFGALWPDSEHSEATSSSLPSLPAVPPPTGIAYDSRLVQNGNLFIALPGRQTDGARYIAEAVKRGASAILHEGVLNDWLPAGVVDIPVADARGAMALLADVYFNHPSHDIDIIGVTGTNGKTTVTFMIRRLLEAAGISCGLVGTVRYEMAGRVIPASRTTPEAPDLQRMFAEARAASTRAVAMEVSSQGLCARRLEQIRFAAAIFTNLTPEHLDFHHDMESYFSAKRRLFDALLTSSATGPAILNTADAYGRRLAADPALAGRLIRFGENPEAAEVWAESPLCTPSGTTFHLHTPWGASPVFLPFIGRHNIENALAACALAGAYGVTPGTMAEALSSMETVPGRLEVVPDPHGGRHLFVDYAHTPDALQNVLCALRSLAPEGRIWCIFGCGGDRDPSKRAKMGEISSKWADFTVLTSDNPRNESPEAILRQISDGMTVRKPVMVDESRPNAIRRTLAMAQRGDIVLLAGKGHETTQEGPHGQKIPMDDRLLLRACL